MSIDCTLQIINMTDQPVEITTTLIHAGDWASPGERNPLVFSGGQIPPYGRTAASPQTLAQGHNSAEFRLSFSTPFGEVGTLADARPVTAPDLAKNMGCRKGYLPTFGDAAPHFQVLEAQHPASSDGNDGKLTIVLIPKIDPRTWMSKLSDDLYLRDLTLPGSHDAGTAAYILGLSRCQDLSIAEQLDKGARYFDIRLDSTYPLEIVHGGSNTGKYFEKDCLAPMAEFLKHRGTKETIVMCINSDAENYFQDSVISLVRRALNNTFGGDNWLDHFEIDTHQKPLKDLRQKIVFMRRYPFDTASTKYLHCRGIEMIEFKNQTGSDTFKWPDDSDSFTEAGGYLFNSAGEPYAIQDRYGLNSFLVPDKVALIEKYLAGWQKGAWFLNFLSGSNAVDFPRGVAEGFYMINAHIFDYIIENGVTPYGTLPMDFMTQPEGLLDLMIASNQKLFVK
ncbi:phosphatidylinositol-specific phospholipase C domain-containing protein [Caulobacter endophyticus]|uniref:phosphatidylinositol-specific phospholipase C domain-containing protein n=1 Tax=Caulobacter endophyticus TaxID=2172652 RepID=UPI002410056D|nr:phosphatidylinositol-specific phospholipase C domain-containing protein [Caulobacter endophyticus]MDG2530115.1 phosphatidylinositol-specific phospholipase C domain-containing protein [Caulobacter endophyticus]